MTEKKIRYTNVDGRKIGYFDYPTLSRDSSRRRMQKSFLKRFSMCGLFEPACKNLKTSSTSIKRWYERDEWFRCEIHEAFQFVIEHSGQELELIPPNRRHKLFATYRVPFEGKQVYDYNGIEVAKDEIITEEGLRQKVLQPLTPEDEEEYEMRIEQIMNSMYSKGGYVAGDEPILVRQIREEMKQRRELIVCNEQ
jgi:hypothetical protein